MIITHVHFQIQPEKEAEFLQEMISLMAESRKEEGNHQYELMKSLEQDFAYTMVEVWENEEAVQAHNESAHFKAFVQNAPAYLAARLKVESYSGSAINN
ncbi:antibiotic biosynthesis monooxygenase [Jeotgalibacillus sp. S-D1]|uniref:putative quinol monooxygenase n=1 Tax=Jeotgalibacillus sp. S-D1 TaxID=2552189 RepID=UPI0010598516|nr:putative quinol monooxygenase [Jeotgalibacillus sp. S-D1]TDL31276.1 antibiotic biosynthesis monooxygenase [Jeotgalibacillus sp. S-D1]